MEQQSKGASAALELDLQEANRRLAALIEQKNGYLQQADVYRALACEPGRSTVANNQCAANLRMQAFTLTETIHAARLRVRNLESQLKSAPAQVAPVALTRNETEGMDDMAGLCGVAA